MHDSNDTLYRIERHLSHLMATQWLILDTLAEMAECGDERIRAISASIQQKTAVLKTAVSTAEPSPPVVP